MTSSMLNDPENATIELSYTPNGDAYGTDMIEIHVIDNQGFSSSIPISISIQNIPDPFVITEHAATADIQEDGSITVTLEYADADGLSEQSAGLDLGNSPVIGEVTLTELAPGLAEWTTVETTMLTEVTPLAFD